MSTKEAFSDLNRKLKDPEKSPDRKRTKLDPAIDSQSKTSIPQWSILRNNISLNNLADIGVSRLEPDSSDEMSETDNYSSCPNDSTGSPDALEIEKNKRLFAILHSTLSKEAILRLAKEDLEARTSKREIRYKINYFQYLPDEVILQVFRWLPKRTLTNAALVCRRWHQLAQDESLWTRMDISNRYLEPGAIGHILSRQTLILRLTNSEIIYPPIFPGVKAASPDFKTRLLYLDLSMAFINEASLATIFSKCYRLKKLSLENVPVNSKVLLNLSQNKDLEILNLSMVDGIDFDGFTYLLAGCRRLRELNIAWTNLSARTIQYVCSHLPSSIDRLNFSGCRKLLNDSNVSDLVTNCPNLRELDLSDCTGLTGSSIEHIAQLQELNFLALSRCYFIPYRSLLLLKSNSSLMYLDVHGGYIDPSELEVVQNSLGHRVNINQFKFSSIARPTVGPCRSSIWSLRVRD